MKIGFCSSNKILSDLVRAGDSTATTFIDQFGLHHAWMIYPAKFQFLKGGWVRTVAVGSRGHNCSVDEIRPRIEKMTVMNREKDYWLLNEFLLMDGSCRDGWSLNALKEVCGFLLGRGGKVILNEMHPPFNAVWHTWRWKKWEALDHIARELVKTHGNLIEVGVQLHSRIETAEFIANALPDLFELLSGVPTHVTEASCLVRDEFQDTATDFYRRTLEIADAGGAISYTPWWLFKTDPNNPPMPPYPYGTSTGLFPALNEGLELETVLDNPLPGWQYFEPYLMK